MSWNDVASNENGYLLQRVNPDGSTTDFQLPPNSSSYMDTGLTPDTVYKYRVRANNFAANSAFTPDVTASTPIAPPTPSNSRLVSVTTNSISLAWKLNSTKPSDGETGIVISRKTGAAGFFQIIADLPAGTTSFSDFGPGVNGLAPGTSFDYHIQAYNVAGYSDFAGVSTFTRTLAPTALVGVGGADKIALSWTAPSGAGTFNVYRGNSAGSETLLASGITDTTYMDASAFGGMTYFYKITASDSGGESASSAEQSIYAHMPGDANDDLTVDFKDLALLSQNYNLSGGKRWIDGDFNGDGVVDFLDLALLAQNYNTTRPPPTAAATQSAAPKQPVKSSVVVRPEKAQVVRHRFSISAICVRS